MRNNLRDRQWQKFVNETVNRVLFEGDEGEKEEKNLQAVGTEEEYKNKYAPIAEWIADLEAAVKGGEVVNTVKLLNDKTGTSQLGIDFLSSGLADGSTSDDAIDVEPTEVACSTLTPTQGEIFFLNSVAYPLTNIGAFTKAAAEKESLLVKSRLSISDGLVLDGHHRWSGTLAINPEIKIQVNNFKFGSPDFKGDQKGGAKLAVLQMGVGTQMEPGQKIPKAGGDGANILGASQNDIESMIWQYCNTSSPDLDGKMLSDDWIKQGQKSPEIREAFRTLGYDISDDDWEKAEVLGDKGGQKVDCRVRTKIASKMAENLATMNPQAANTPSEREFMPQLDHEDIGEDAGFQNIKNHADNHEINFDEPSKVFESTVTRWNKLAGLLKD